MAKIKFNKIAALTLTLSMVMSSSVFASTLQQNITSNSKHYSCTSGRNNKGDCNFKNKLDGLVTANTITQAQEDALVKLVATKPAQCDLKTTLDGAVKTGTITQTQEDSIIKNLIPIKGSEQIKTKLDTLVISGNITRAQEDAMINALTVH